MGAHHPKHAAGADSRRMQRIAMTVIVPIGILTLIAMVWLWPSGGVEVAGQSAAPELSGQIVSVDKERCEQAQPDDVNGCGTARVQLDEESRVATGEDAEEIEAPLPNGPGAPSVHEGDDVIVVAAESPDGKSYSIVDHQRGHEMVLLAVAFVLALVTFGRWRGVSALAGLVVTFCLLLFFVVPAILDGQPPLLVAIVGSSAIMLTVLYLTHGWAVSTTVAVLGTLISLTLTGLLSAVTVSALHLTGITDDISNAVGSGHSVNMEGLLLAGIVIGSLGVLDDVTVTQAATVDELARANPAYGARLLYRAASRVGRSHIASVVNTIVLAYAGSSLPLLVLIVADNGGLGSVVTNQVLAQEIVRSLVATLGLIAAVPVTTGLAALAARRSIPDAP